MDQFPFGAKVLCAVVQFINLDEPLPDTVDELPVRERSALMKVVLADFWGLLEAASYLGCPTVRRLCLNFAMQHFSTEERMRVVTMLARQGAEEEWILKLCCGCVKDDIVFTAEVAAESTQGAMSLLKAHEAAPESGWFAKVRGFFGFGEVSEPSRMKLPAFVLAALRACRAGENEHVRFLVQHCSSCEDADLVWLLDKLLAADDREVDRAALRLFKQVRDYNLFINVCVPLSWLACIGVSPGRVLLGKALDRLTTAQGRSLMEALEDESSGLRGFLMPPVPDAASTPLSPTARGSDPCFRFKAALVEWCGAKPQRHSAQARLIFDSLLTSSNGLLDVYGAPVSWTAEHPDRPLAAVRFVRIHLEAAGDDEAVEALAHFSALRWQLADAATLCTAFRRLLQLRVRALPGEEEMLGRCLQELPTTPFDALQVLATAEELTPAVFLDCYLRLRNAQNLDHTKRQLVTDLFVRICRLLLMDLADSEQTQLQAQVLMLPLGLLPTSLLQEHAAVLPAGITRAAADAQAVLHRMASLERELVQVKDRLSQTERENRQLKKDLAAAVRRVQAEG